MRYDYIIWDFNGTLLNDVQLCFDLLNKMLSKRNIPTVSMERYKEIFRFPVSEYYKLAGFDFDKEPFAVTAVEFIDDYQPMSMDCSLYKGTKEVLDKLNKMGVKQLILSASEINNLKEQTKHFGLDEYMIDILGTDTIHAISKKEIAKNWIKERKLNPKRILFIGDTNHDFEVATYIGVDCALIANGHQNKERLLNVCENVLDDISEVVKYIEK